MPNIADSLMHKTFIKRLEACESAPPWLFNDWQKEFLGGMRASYESREDAIDMGLTAWNPTASQWNTLAIMYEKAS